MCPLSLCLCSIHNLKKAVIKGSYEPIPSVYSADLTTIITKFMALNPTDRPEAKYVSLI